MKHFDVVVIGGGVVGLSAAYGLVKKKVSVAVFDEGDVAFRASRSNFGLVWFQGKGEGSQDYVHLMRQSTQQWKLFVEELEGDSGTNVDYRQTGGLSLCIGEAAAEQRKKQIDNLKKQSGDEDYECEFLSRSELEGLFYPLKLGVKVQTASYSPRDGHVNPLFLMFALYKSFVSLGGHYYGDSKVTDIVPVSGNGFELRTNAGIIGCDRLLLSAGLGLQSLGPKVGLDIPVYPERGQILVTQRAEKLFPLPMSGFRQSEEGTVLLGFSNEDAGFDDQTSIQVTAKIAKKATTVFPQLSNLRLVRTWAGLRIQSADKYPVYAESKRYPGAYAATCHSGITLASLHTNLLPDWILTGEVPSCIKQFGLERFNV